jgi:hypothetical protein
MQIVELGTGLDLKYPNGNVVLAPTSSREIILKIDLPPSIEEKPETVIRPNIIFDLLSGSFPIIPPTATSPSPSISDFRITVSAGGDLPVTLFSGQTLDVDITVFQGNDPITSAPELTIESNNPAVADITKPTQLVSSYSPVRIRAISGGEAEIKLTYQDAEASIFVTVVQTTTGGPAGPSSPRENPRREDNDESGGPIDQL